MAQWVEGNVLHIDVGLDESSQLIELGLDQSSQEFEIELVGGGSGRFPWYEGAYVVDPRKVEQVLNTEHKSMRGDVTINPIFYAETGNIGGGFTAVIGLE